MKPLVGLLALIASSSAFPQVGLMPGGGTSNVQFGPLAQGMDLTTNSPGVYVFNEPVSFSNYWQTNHRGPAPALQSNFFQSWRLVAIHLGNRPGPGYGLGVLGINRRIDQAIISAVETVPPARRGGQEQGSRRGQPATTSPWILLRVERGAFGFVLQTRQMQGYANSGVSQGGRTVKLGNGVTATFPPGYCPP